MGSQIGWGGAARRGDGGISSRFCLCRVARRDNCQGGSGGPITCQRLEKGNISGESAYLVADLTVVLKKEAQSAVPFLSLPMKLTAATSQVSGAPRLAWPPTPLRRDLPRRQLLVEHPAATTAPSTRKHKDAMTPNRARISFFPLSLPLNQVTRFSDHVFAGAANLFNLIYLYP